MANILAAPLISLADSLSSLTQSGGLLCLAGLIAPQAEAVKAPYQKQFQFTPDARREEWVRLTAVKG